LIKRIIKSMLGFKRFPSACATISGIEIMHMIRKKQAGVMSPLDEVAFVYNVMHIG
jgi:transposase-like protein